MTFIRGLVAVGVAVAVITVMPTGAQLESVAAEVPHSRDGMSIEEMYAEDFDVSLDEAARRLAARLVTGSQTEASWIADLVDRLAPGVSVEVAAVRDHSVSRMTDEINANLAH